jgi:hypothetical protein
MMVARNLEVTHHIESMARDVDGHAKGTKDDNRGIPPFFIYTLAFLITPSVRIHVSYFLKSISQHAMVDISSQGTSGEENSDHALSSRSFHQP